MFRRMHPQMIPEVLVREVVKAKGLKTRPTTYRNVKVRMQDKAP